MKKVLKKVFGTLLAFCLVLNLLPSKVFADEGIVVNVNIYVNDSLAATDIATDTDFPELEYGSFPFGWLYGDAYGDYEKATVMIDGRKGIVFCFDGENASIFPADWSDLYGKEVILNLYYSQAQEALEAEPEYGRVGFDFFDQNSNPLPGYELSLTGKKGAETISATAVDDENGIAWIELDKSYAWSYRVNGYLYEIDFEYDEGWLLDTQVRIEEPVVEEPVVEEPVIEEPVIEEPVIEEPVIEEPIIEEPVIEEPIIEEPIVEEPAVEEEIEVKEYKVTILHQFSAAPGGRMVDGFAENAHKVVEGKEITVKSGESFRLDSELLSTSEFTYNEEDHSIMLGNDLYRVGTVYIAGSHESNGNAADSEITVTDQDLTIRINYTFVKQYITVEVEYIDEEGNSIFMTSHREYEASSDLNGEKEYDFSDAYAFPIKGYEFKETRGDAVKGIADSDKVIYMVYTKIVEEPVEEEPTPVIEEPVIEEPIIEEPVIEEPVVEEPVIEEPVIEEPVIEEPVVVEPVIEEPIVEEPTIVEPAPVAEEPAVVPAPVVEYTPAPSQPAYEEPAAVEEVVIEEPIVEIEEVEVPMAAVTEEIADVEAPLTEARASWALANLLAAIATVIATLAMYVTYFKKQENDEEDENEGREENSERKTSKLFSIIPAAVSVILFILTEDMRNPMVLFDKWTLLMMVIMIGNLVVAYLTRNKKEDEEKEENEAVA